MNAASPCGNVQNNRTHAFMHLEGYKVRKTDKIETCWREKKRQDVRTLKTDFNMSTSLKSTSSP